MFGNGPTSPLSFGRIVGGISKTLSIANQVLPLYNQAKPMINNAKNIFGVLKGFSNGQPKKELTSQSKVTVNSSQKNYQRTGNYPVFLR